MHTIPVFARELKGATQHRTVTNHFYSKATRWSDSLASISQEKGVKRVLAFLQHTALPHLLQDSWLFPDFSPCELGSRSLLTAARKKKKIDGTRYARYQAHDCWQISKYFSGLCWKHIPGDTVRVYKVFWGEHCSMEKQRRNLTKATLQKAKK